MLELSEFYTHSKMADGHLNFCKDCVKSRVSSHRDSNLERIQKYDRDRSREPKRKEHLTKNFQKMVELYPEKRQARTAVSNALRDGRLTRQPCMVCGKQRSEAHHPDYSQPLLVEWLCRKHHMEAHKNV